MPSIQAIAPKTTVPKAPALGNGSRFGKTGLAAVIGPDAIQSFLVDTAGVYAPKLPVLRSKTQFFEETFLEFVEDGAFYFSVPVFGRFVAAPFFKKYFGVDKLHRHDLQEYLVNTTLPNAGIPKAQHAEVIETLKHFEPHLKDDQRLLKQILHHREGLNLTATQRQGMASETQLLDKLKTFKTDDLKAKLEFALKEAHAHHPGEKYETIRKGALALYQETPHSEILGTSLRHWANKGLTPNRAILAAKAGVLISSVAFAAAFEYMIQHAKNVITAKAFHTNNFTAVAGLEKARIQLKDGEADPVAKAKRRAWQIGGLLGASFVAAATVPKLIFNSAKNAEKAFHILKEVDFSHRSAFGLSRVLLAGIMGAGVVSYLDASRDELEFKETGTRLLGVVPYLMFAKAWSNNGLATILGNRTVDVNGKPKTVSELIALREDEAHHLTDSKLDFGRTKGYLEYGKANQEAFLKAIEKNGPLPQSVKDFLLAQRRIHVVGSYALGAGVFGIGLLSLSYWQTKKRFDKLTASEKAELARQEAAERADKLAKEEHKHNSTFFYAPGYAPAAFGTNPFAVAPYTPSVYRNY